ncbi:AraC family transcriptional regulator [Herbiconiux ginsengi]|uniref:Transcriptional regulator, AraC family n=1 Tax=Herbiconiux ginsengi TaxID=381665 RepID=A0A1H3RJR9_9MICO|nr:AraC family transcriptional regulator [Herbiconiux ginsengi]SDZ26002.1 transcriptional regulator, AraC family [Herbiconiux ginsengi]
MQLPSNSACVLVQMSAKTLVDAPAYRRMSRHEFGGLAMARIASVPQKVTAILGEVPARSPESIQVQLVHSGELILDQGGRQTSVAAGGVVVYDVSRPFEFVYPQEFRTTIVQMPTASTGVSNGVLKTLSERGSTHRSPAGAVLSRLLRAAGAHGQQLGENSRDALSRAIVDAVRMVTREHAGGGTLDSGRAGLAEAARDVARVHLSDPGLSATVIANRLHVSVRTLHAAFEDERETLGQLIRRLRLERARQQLEGTTAPVRQIAESIGYLDVTHFIRTFKTTENLTPAQWRRRRLGGTGEGPRP